MNRKSLCLCSILLAAFASASGQEGMTVVRDPETGKLRAPTAVELRELRDKEEHPQLAPVKPRSVVRPDGTRKVELGERGMVYSVMTRAPDGKLQRTCVHAKDGVEALEKHQKAEHVHP